MSKYKDTDKEAFARISESLINWRDATIDLASVITEAKAREIWKVKYDSWTDFLQIECGITRSWAHKLITANKAMLQIANSEPPKPLQNRETDVSNGNTSTAPKISVSAALELGKVPELDRPAVLAQAVLSGPVTARSIAAASPPQAPPAIQLDDAGFPIPHDCLEYWRRSGEIQELLTAVSRIKAKLEAKRAEDDVLYRNISQAVVNELALAYSFIANAKPYAVCLNCQGKVKDSCRGCKGTGFMAKFAYEHEQVKGLRTMREAVMAKGKK